jgi:hemerythrin-like domain-containing protein
MLLKIGRSSERETLVELLLACHERIRRFSRLACTLAERDDLPEAEVLDAVERCTRYFAEALPLHVRDEEDSVLPRLCARSPELDAALDAMRAEHADHEPGLRALLGALAALRDAPLEARARERLLEVAAPLAQELEQHLQAEETRIFPELRGLLSPEAEREAIAELRARRSDRS